MPRSIEPLAIRRAAQLKALAQVRNTLPRAVRAAVEELFATAAAERTDKQLELIGTLASTYLREVV